MLKGKFEKKENPAQFGVEKKEIKCKQCSFDGILTFQKVGKNGTCFLKNLINFCPNCATLNK